MAIGSWLNGRMLDAQYQKYKRQAEAQRPETAAPVDLNQEESFPLEKVGHSSLFVHPSLNSAYSLGPS